MLLFDLGGVVYTIDFKKAFEAWSAISQFGPEDLARHFSMDAAYAQHETGRINWTEYARHLRTRLKLEGTDEEIAAGWNAIFLGEFDAVTDIVRRVRGRIRCCVLSNSNPVHKAYLCSRYGETLSLFDQLFISSDIRFRKPDANAFQHVADSLSCSFGDILFFDDTLEIVERAREMGIETIHVQSEQDVVGRIEQLGIG